MSYWNCLHLIGTHNQCSNPASIQDVPNYKVSLRSLRISVPKVPKVARKVVSGRIANAIVAKIVRTIAYFFTIQYC